jgi:hypothetical protein
MVGTTVLFLHVQLCLHSDIYIWDCRVVDSKNFVVLYEHLINSASLSICLNILWVQRLVLLAWLGFNMFFWIPATWRFILLTTHLGLVRFYPNPYGLRGFQSQISQNPLQSVSIPSNPYGLKITEQALKGFYELVDTRVAVIQFTNNFRLLSSKVIQTNCRGP